MDPIFPANPVEGQVFEASPNVLYKYSVATNSWARIVQPSIPLATPISDGLMTVSDYKKLTGIIDTPPSATLAVDGGNKVTQGYVNLRGDGIFNIEVDEQNIHENTGLINVSLDVDRLIDKLKTAGKLRFNLPIGDAGDIGDRGDSGRDSLPVGPYGKDGVPGANAEWPGSLVEENLEIKDDNRAIVDVSVSKIGDNENYLVVKRANIGNPDACPDSIQPQDVQSPWLLAFTGDTTSIVRTRTADGKLVCSWACNSNLFYFNIDSIIQTIRQRFVQYLLALKSSKENYTQSQLERLMTIFDQQKAALCCALEAAHSRVRNAEARKYLETAKIAGATADATKPGYRMIIKQKSEGVTPSFYKPCDYNLVNLGGGGGGGQSSTTTVPYPSSSIRYYYDSRTGTWYTAPINMLSSTALTPGIGYT